MPDVTHPRSVAIVGAGIAGLSCAQTLLAAGVKVTVYESGSAVGGRCSTRLWQGHLVDVGVQYFTAQTTEFKKELLTRLRQFRPIISPVLDQNEEVVPTTAGPRFYVLQGNHYFAHVLSQGLDVRLNAPVESLERTAGGFLCHGDTVDAIVSAVPGPVVARLFNLPTDPATYNSCIVALFEYNGSVVGNSRECYARLVPENMSPIMATYCENNKVGRIVGDKAIFVVQASAEFTRDYGYLPPEDYLPILARENERMWEIEDQTSRASYAHLWSYARPVERSAYQLPPGAFICGDSRAESTIEHVWLDGRAAAQEVLGYLQS